MTSVLVVDNYDSFTYNLVQYLGELGADVEVVRNDLPELLERSPDRVIVSPGPCTPEEAGLSKEAIRRSFAFARVVKVRIISAPPLDNASHSLIRNVRQRTFGVKASTPA